MQTDRPPAKGFQTRVDNCGVCRRDGYPWSLLVECLDRGGLVFKAIQMGPGWSLRPCWGLLASVGDLDRSRARRCCSARKRKRRRRERQPSATRSRGHPVAFLLVNVWFLGGLRRSRRWGTPSLLFHQALCDRDPCTASNARCVSHRVPRPRRS